MRTHHEASAVATEIGAIGHGLLMSGEKDADDFLICAFGWVSAAALYDDMTAEEIASMALDGFEVCG